MPFNFCFNITNTCYRISSTKKIFKIQAKKELLLKVFLILSSFLLYSFFFSFIIPKYLTVNYIFAPFIFEYIKIIINSVQIKI